MRTEFIKANAFRVIKNDIVMGTVFKNWQGWCWASWRGTKPAGVCTNQDEAMVALLAATK